MADSIRHRGPDEEGLWLEGICGLAHRRLSIIDLAGSQQPLAPKDSSIVLVYNGELYNYRELRSHYRSRDVPFATHGDTEVLLRAIEREWDGAPSECDGMYAFAAWDRRRQRLLLARDPLGKKPLFYAQPRQDLFVFASEIKALFQHPEVSCGLDLGGLRQVLRFRAVYGGNTLYSGVRQLAPGTSLEVRAAGIRQRTHYRLADAVATAHPRRSESEGELIHRGRELLTAAVRKRLIADVPVGAFLSGGLDSSLIVALIKQCRDEGEPTHTFSVGFKGDSQSELTHARTVSNALGTTHTEVQLSPVDYAASLTSATAYRDAPVSEPADVAILRMSEVAKRTVKVVLSGEGADEVFCGYPKYGFASAPALLRALLRWVGPDRVTRMAQVLGVDPRRTRVAARSLAATTELDRLVQWFSYLDRKDLAGLFPGLGWSDSDWLQTTHAQAAALAACPVGDAALRMQVVDCTTWLPGNLLERGDRMTMAAGLEARVPFLDPEVVAYGLQLNRRMKIRGRSLKWVVRSWADELLPEEIVKRPKWGFRVPLAEWFRSELREMLHDYLSSAGSLCELFGDRPAIQALLRSHDSGAADNNLVLWTLLTTEVWYREIFRARDGGA